MEYGEVLPKTRSEVERLLTSGNEMAIAEALLSSAHHDRDWQWVQGQCLRLLDHPAPEVQRSAVVCLGHIARIHGTVDTALLFPKLVALKTADLSIADSVDDALEDIKIFARLH